MDNDDIIYSTNAVGKKLYICKKCYKRYSTQKNFDNHLTSCKEVNEELKCTKCYSLFTSVKSKLRHDKDCIKEEEEREQKFEITEERINEDKIKFNIMVNEYIKTIKDEDKNKIIFDAMKYKCVKDSKTIFLTSILEKIRDTRKEINNDSTTVCEFLVNMLNNNEYIEDNQFLAFFYNIMVMEIK
jgi:hypothetical protein